MKQWWVYELRAGDWIYIGQTLDPKKRLREHRFAIRHKKHCQKWSRALQEFPTPEDWEMTVVAGPFLTKEDAISEEERLQREREQYQGRLWDRFGNAYSDELKERRSGENHPFYGKKHSDETIAKLTGKPGPRLGKKSSPQHIARMKATCAARRYTRAFFDWLSEPTT